MRSKEKTSRLKRPPQSPKDIAADIAARSPFDRTKVRRESRRAVQAADRLLKEMGDVLKQLDRKA